MSEQNVVQSSAEPRFAESGAEAGDEIRSMAATMEALVAAAAAKDREIRRLNEVLAAERRMALSARFLAEKSKPKAVANAAPTGLTHLDFDALVQVTAREVRRDMRKRRLHSRFGRWLRNLFKGKK